MQLTRLYNCSLTDLKEWNKLNDKYIRDGDFLCTIDEFFKASCNECKDKCRKKPKHCYLIAELLKDCKWKVGYNKNTN